jgi:transcriptional regulator with XRE-family HTH domain
MDIKLRIGGQIRAMRRVKGLTQAELADKVGRSTEAISNMEATSLPGLDTLEAIASALDAPLEVFFAQQGAGKLGRDRADLLHKLNAVANTLSDKKLKLALVQVEAIASMN